MQKQIRGVEHRIVSTIGENYSYALKRIADFAKERHLSASQTEILNLYKKYVKSVERALSHLDRLEVFLLRNEYLNPLQKGWWCGCYTRSTFYRLRLAITKKFIAYYQGNYGIGFENL